RNLASHQRQASRSLPGRNDLPLQSPEECQFVLGYPASYGHGPNSHVRKAHGIAGMSKGKHKRKSKYPQQQAQQQEPNIPLLKNEKVSSNDDAETPKERTEQSKHGENPSMLTKFKEWVKRGSTFTDWCIAAFTCVLAF